jgi:hypothetical protein
MLRRDDGPEELTVLHMVGAPDVGGYEVRAAEWGHAVWQAWRRHHDLIATVVKQFTSD